MWLCRAFPSFYSYITAPSLLLLSLLSSTWITGSSCVGVFCFPSPPGTTPQVRWSLCCHGGGHPPCGAMEGYLGLPPTPRPGSLLLGLPCMERTCPLAGQYALETALPRLPRVPPPQLAKSTPPGAPVLEGGPKAARPGQPHLDPKRCGASILRLPPPLPPEKGSAHLARRAQV